MSKNAFSSMPGGRRVAHVLLASMLLAAAGASTALAGGGKGRGPDDDRNKQSGMSRMQQMGRPQQQQSAPAPRQEAPRQQQSAPRQAPAPQPMMRPMPAQEAPRMVAPPPPQSQGRGIMQLRSQQDSAPQQRSFSPAPQFIPPQYVPPSPPQVMPRQQAPSPSMPQVQGINRLRAPQDRTDSIDEAPAPKQLPSPTQPRQFSVPQVKEAPSVPQASSTSIAGNAPINRLRGPERLPEAPSIERASGAVLGAPSNPGANFTRSRGTVAKITTDPKAPGAPIMKLRAPALHEAPLPGPTSPTVPGVEHLANTRLPVDARVADASRRWRDHDRRDGDWDRHGRHDHDFRDFDHHRSHFRPVFVTDVVFYEPWTWGPSYVCAPTLPTSFCRWDSGWSWSLGWSSCSDFSVGFTFGDPWCAFPAYHHRYRSYFSTCYNPIAYSLEYPTYAYTYPSYPVDYGTTTINNYYTSPLYADYSAQTSMPDYRAYATQPQGQVYTNDGMVPNPAPVAGIAQPGDDAVTVYRSTKDRGQMAWSDTAASIINALVAAPGDQRHVTAKQYLGRTPVGAWEATFEGRQDFDGATELTCRGTTVTSTGGRPTIVVRVNKTVGAITPGQRVSITGRLTEVSVDDSSNPGGMLVLEDAQVSW